MVITRIRAITHEYYLIQKMAVLDFFNTVFYTGYAHRSIAFILSVGLLHVVHGHTRHAYGKDFYWFDQYVCVNLSQYRVTVQVFTYQ